MKAQWKIPALDRTKRLNDIEQLRLEIAELRKANLDLKEDRKLNEAALAAARQQAIEYLVDSRRLNALCASEVMVPTEEGFKLLTGDELRAYCDQLDIKLRRSLWYTSPAVEQSFDLAYSVYKKQYGTNTRSKS